MSYARIPPRPPASLRSWDAAHEHPGSEHSLSANAEAWRRLAVVGYRRAAQMVRATQGDDASRDAADEDRTPSADTHQSGFQSL
ncbi:hypothetical protein [Rhodoferax mekongensis]|uniref:Uncharacterized protein n=1 Tax=Rhodoferax mekongensis TaxID=3068341 RepID=A0ABZ0B1C3_9BURK|nr:hypothetical protein [Rhodoferax sp. TBRC 17307]NBX20298.1 hypothetical protein [Betaproteobacteria bacterium]WNO04742.1 hypothetical protein RAN89_17920 [Rhodoferax sp. TBRC 17307]